MKVRDMFDKIKKPELKEWSREDLMSRGLPKEFELDMEHFNWSKFNSSQRLTGYWLSHWESFGKTVGISLYFFDGEPCARTYQPNYNSIKTWAWVSKEKYKEVRAFVESFIEKEEFNPVLLDLETDIPETYKLENREQLYSNEREVYLNGRPVTILGIGERNFYNGVPEDFITIRHADGEEETVEMTQLNFPLELNNIDMKEK